MDPRTERALRRGRADFREIVGKLPRLARPPLPEDWLAAEVTERRILLRHAPLGAGSRVVEIGAGAHGLATVPLAFAVGPRGRVTAVERARWAYFRDVVEASHLGDRIDGLRADAARLPLRADCADLSLCVHGIRSLGDDDACVRILREMFRVSPRVWLAETLPAGRTPAQRAHLAMYRLREEALLAATGRRDDLAYRTLDELCGLVERAGGTVRERQTVEVDLPHALAYFPRAILDNVNDPVRRRVLQASWDDAREQLRRHGADHPPVGIVLGAR